MVQPSRRLGAPSPKDDLFVRTKRDVNKLDRKFSIAELFRTSYIKGWEHMDDQERLNAALKLCGYKNMNLAPNQYLMKQYKETDPALWLLGVYDN